MNKLTVKTLASILISLLSVFVAIVYFRDKEFNKRKQIKLIKLKLKLIGLYTNTTIDSQYDFNNMSNQQLKTINLELDKQVKECFDV